MVGHVKLQEAFPGERAAACPLVAFPRVRRYLTKTNLNMLPEAIFQDLTALEAL